MVLFDAAVISALDVASHRTASARGPRSFGQTGCLGGTCLVDVTHHQVGSFGCEGLRGRSADTVTGARDERDLACELTCTVATACHCVLHS